MLCSVLRLVLSTAAAAAAAVAATTPFQGSALVPASQFAGYNDTQSPFAGRDALRRLLNRQLTCDPGYGQCPNGGCCPLADNCCSNSDLCVQVGGACCDDKQHTCPSGWNCCGAYCSPISAQCCTTGYYCPSGWWCVLYSGEQYCCYGLGCLGTYNPQDVAVPTITGFNLVAPTNGAGGGGGASSTAPSGGSEASSTYVPPPGSGTTPYPTTEPPSAATAMVYKNYYFTITWSYESYYYTGTAVWEYTWQTKDDSTTVSFYCSDYEDASYSAEMYSLTGNFPTPTNAALPSFTSSAAATATATGFGAGSGGSSSGTTAGPSNCAGRYLGLIIVSCWLANLVL